MTKQTFDDLINQINTVSNDVQRERGTLFGFSVSNEIKILMGIIV